jgi:anti-sigma factor RsiW
MNCAEVSNVAPLYLTGELEPGRAAELAAHIKGCASCAWELGQQKAFDAVLRETVLAEQVDSSRVERGVRLMIGHLVVRQSVGPASARRWMFALAGLAAVLLLAVFLMRARPVYAAAANDHRLEIVELQPRQWSTDRASIAAMAQRQGVSDSDLDRIAPAGYHTQPAGS